MAFIRVLCSGTILLVILFVCCYLTKAGVLAAIKLRGPGVSSGFLPSTHLPISKGWTAGSATEHIDKGSGCGLEPRASRLLTNI